MGVEEKEQEQQQEPGLEAAAGLRSTLAGGTQGDFAPGQAHSTEYPPLGAAFAPPDEPNSPEKLADFSEKPPIAKVADALQSVFPGWETHEHTADNAAFFENMQMIANFLSKLAETKSVAEMVAEIKRLIEEPPAETVPPDPGNP